jgi:hypothetical protein
MKQKPTKISKDKLLKRDLNRENFFIDYLMIKTAPNNLEQFIRVELIKFVHLDEFDEALTNRDADYKADAYLKRVADDLIRQGLKPGPTIAIKDDPRSTQHVYSGLSSYKKNPRYEKAGDRREPEGTGGTGDRYH